MSFLGVIGSVEKFPLVDLQLYFLIYKPEFTSEFTPEFTPEFTYLENATMIQF